MTKNQKRAFTLTELLVTVVIIGILSAVVLPKFNKVMEGIKTGEAERMLTAVRTEQEARCTLGQDYLADGAKVRAFPGNTSKNYTYAFSGNGMSAESKTSNYTLQMPSYMNGRICCEGTGCAGLNKDYPTCEALKALPNYQPGTECAAALPPPQGCGEKPTQPADKPCGCNNTGHQSYTWNEETCEWKLGTTCEGENTAPCEIPACVKPIKPEDKLCGCNNTGHQTYTWNESACKWELGSTCEGEDTSACLEKECSGENTRQCGCGYRGTQTRECDTTTGEWKPWGPCSAPSTPSQTVETRACDFKKYYPYQYNSDPGTGGVNVTGTGKQTRTFSTSSCSWGAWGSCSIEVWASWGPYTQPSNKSICDGKPLCSSMGVITNGSGPCSVSGVGSNNICKVPYGSGCYIYHCEQITQ